MDGPTAPHPEAVGRLAGTRQATSADGLRRRLAELDARAVVLVEGRSDEQALDALALRRGRRLAAEGITILPMGGASPIAGYLHVLGPQGQNLRLAGLCDAAEAGDVRRGLEWAGLGSDLTWADMEALGFHVCVADLEDELIRALGAGRVERLIEAQGELAAFRRFQWQPPQRARDPVAQLRRFMGTRAGRKVQYARLMVEALDLDRVPRPLDGVLAHVADDDAA